MVTMAAAALSLVAFQFDASAQARTTSSGSSSTTTTTTTSARSTSSSSKVTTPAASTSAQTTSAARSTSSTSTSTSGQTVRGTGDGTGSTTATTASRQTTGTASTSAKSAGSVAARQTTSTSTSTAARQTSSASTSSTAARQTTSASTGNAASSAKQTTSAKAAESASAKSSSSTGGSTSSGSRNAEIVVKDAGSARTNTNLTSAGLSTSVEPSKSQASGRPLDGSYNSQKAEPYRDRGGNYRYDDREFRIDDHNIHRVPPRDRGFMSYDRPGGFFYDRPHYYGYRVNYLPPRYRRVTYWGVDYYLYDGIYYRLHGGTYYICRPPAGILVTRAIDRALLNIVTFAYFHNVHRTYSTVFDNYARIAEQNRIIAENNALIARQNASYALNSNRALSAYEIANRLGLVQSYAYANSDYYYQDGVFYLFSTTGQYTVIIPPAGALVTSLPDDYEVIVLDGIEYYLVDNTVYRTTIFDCQPYLEVLGQMYGSLANKYSYYR